MPAFTHVDKEGYVRMVDITEKESTLRVAVAQGVVFMNPAVLEMIHNQTVKKGNVLEAARIAGIMAAKKTPELIPLCHSLNVTHITVDFFLNRASGSIRIEATARLFGQTGVEMEVLTAVSVAALTIYDMCKSHDKKMIISDIFLLEKSGGKNGPF